MELIMLSLLITFTICAVCSIVYFIRFLTKGSLPTSRRFLIVEIISVVIAPIAYLLTMDSGKLNDCCADSAVFAPEHRASIYVLIFICMATYFYAAYRKAITSPVIEILLNTLLVTGIVLNIVIFIQVDDVWLAAIGNIPVILFFVLNLARNQRRLVEHIQEMGIQPRNAFERIALYILTLPPIVKYPQLVIFCLPVLIITTTLLLLVGQQPDSYIRAFTDTYKHGFSQLDYMCDNVACGGHFLCSVAAKGHQQIVKPTRLGVRNERFILCNRQLLISNAFEDLLQQKLPFLHKPIRRSYNRVGDVIHRYYSVFNKKWICDIVYVLMKPAEWLFLLVLYTFDRHPENRIAKQYISREIRQQIEQQG